MPLIRETTIIDIFPIEILDHIIGIIAEDDNHHHRCEWPSVKACSLTCRTLAALCRPHIFRCVRLCDFDRSPEQVSTGMPPHSLARSFGELITKKPEIANYVREVDFMVNNIDDGGPISALVALERLGKLETLSIRTVASAAGAPPDHSKNWQKLHSVPRMIFNKFLRCPRLTSVKVLSIYSFTTTDLVPCTNLQSLTLQDGHIEDEMDPPTTLGKPIQLRELNMPHPYTINADKFLPLKHKDGTLVFDTTELRKFNSCIYGGVSVLHHTPEIIKSAPNLEELHLYFSISEPWETMADLLSSLRALRCLSLACEIDSDDFSEISQSDHYSDMISLLKNLSTTTHIESLKLCIQSSFNGTANYDALKECILELGWPFLTRVELSTFNRCPRERGIFTRSLRFQNSVVTLHRLSPDVLLEFWVHTYKGFMADDEAAFGC